MASDPLFQDAAGGGAQCNTVAVASFGTLLAAPGPCEQQDAADNMIDLAKTLNSNADMISFAQIFAQQPRNSPNSLSVPYCQQAPKNAELNGLFQCQYQGSSSTAFVGGLKPGQAGTIPFGMTAILSPAGSCLANPSGPIADGTQLTDITSNPGVSAGGSSAASEVLSSATTDTAPCTSTVTVSSATAPAATSAAISAGVTAPTAVSGSVSTSSFALQNGKDAQKLNAQFASLTTSSSCKS
ncbi:hypothetical protein HWV62_17082 [Athelia sp. TMB]|nr:hypothetical protein HWV62_17082 [Athelia sp. TMB]